MGRHSAPTSALPELLPTTVTRTSHRAPKRVRARATAPLWRRSPALPAAAMVFLVTGGATAAHLPAAVSAARTQPQPAQAARTTTPKFAADAPARVSRAKRTITQSPTVEANSPSSVLVKPKPVAKPVIAGKTVAGTWFRPSAGQESSCFCVRWGEMHEGIDLAGPLGSPIVAAGAGVVIDAGPAEGYGLWVVIQLPNGDVNIYGHMYHYYVTVGEHVSAGQHIADIGANGEATGPHLHFGVRQGGPDGPYLDPVPWLKARGVEVGAYNPNA